MKAMVKEWIDALVKFDDDDLAELEKGIKETRLALREVKRNEAIQKFKEAYLELCNWADIYYDFDVDGYGLTRLVDFDNFSFE